MSYEALRGKIIAELIDPAVVAGGIIVVARKEDAFRARVLSVGGPQRAGKRLFNPPCKPGDIIYFKRGKPVSLEHYGQGGLKKGKFMIYFDEVVGVEEKTKESL